jgi:hypothetical protein
MQRNGNPDRIWHYPSPTAVLSDPRLSERDKRELLRRWALNAYASERAFPGTGAAARSSRLDDVIDALLDLDEPEIRNLAQRNAGQHSRPPLTRQAGA